MVRRQCVQRKAGNPKSTGDETGNTPISIPSRGLRLLVRCRVRYAVIVRLGFADLKDRVQFRNLQYPLPSSCWIQQLEINTSSLERNQKSYSSRIDGINAAQIENDIAATMPNSRAQNGGLFAPHNLAQTSQNHVVIQLLDSHSQHGHLLRDLAGSPGNYGAGTVHCRRTKGEYQSKVETAHDLPEVPRLRPWEWWPGLHAYRNASPCPGGTYRAPRESSAPSARSCGDASTCAGQVGRGIRQTESCSEAKGPRLARS